ncbi:MAG: lamin tail domain-containing protein, partial [Saprospiraceae bacterium]
PDTTHGYVEVNNNLKIRTNEWSGDYFAGVPVTLHAVAEPGYAFSHWEQDSTITDSEIELDVNTATSVTPIFMAQPVAAGDLIINEINYKSSDDHDTGDWVELYNNSGAELNVSNWVFRDDDDTHEFIFPAGTIIPADGYLLLVRDLDKFQDFHPDLPNVIGEFDFGLSSNGDQVRIYRETLVLEDSVAYLSESPWPTSPAGDGPTLELLSPELNNEIAQNWADLRDYGSPGLINEPNSLVTYNGARPVAVRVSPNPSQGQLTIDLDLTDAAEVQFMVFDAWGTNVYTTAVRTLSTGTHRLPTDLGRLPAGAYFIRVIVDQVPRGVARWIKQ